MEVIVEDFDFEKEEKVKVVTPVSFWRLSLSFSSIYIASQLYHNENYFLTAIWIIFAILNIKFNK